MHKLIIIAITILSFSACKVKFNTGTATNGHSAMALSGPENWTVDGKAVSVLRSYFLALPEGLQYTIETPFDFGHGRGQITMSQSQATDAAFPLMKYAYENNLYSRSSISKVGSGSLTPTRIGVVLIQNLGGGQARGTKVALSFEEIKARSAKQ